MLLVGPHHGEPAPIQRVLACVDGSKLSEAIVPAARRWARAAGTLLWLIHAVEPNPSLGVERSDSNYVQRVAEGPDRDGIDLEFGVLHGDHPQSINRRSRESAARHADSVSQPRPLRCSLDHDGQYGDGSHPACHRSNTGCSSILARSFLRSSV